VSLPEYGLFLLVKSLSAALLLLDLGISGVLVQAYVESFASEGKERFSDLLSSVFLVLAALGFLGVLMFSGLAASLPGPFNISPQYLHEASIIFIVAALVIQIELPAMAIEHAYRAYHRFDRINQIQLATATAQIVLSLLALTAGFRVVALALVQLTVSFLHLCFLVAALPGSVPRARLRLTRFKWALVQPLMKLSKWAFLNSLSGYFFDLLAWIALGSFASMKEVALYGIASRLPYQLWNVMDRGAVIALPLLSRFSAEADQARLQQTFLKTQKLLFGIILPFVVLGCFVARPLIQIWVGTQYAGAAIVMQLLLLGVITHASGYSSVQLLFACGKVKKAASISFWEYLVSIACAPLLVSRFGAAGLAAGMAITQLFINWGWYAWEACNTANVSPKTLLRAVLNGLEWPIVALVTGIVLISSIRSHLSPLWLVVAATVSGLAYLVLWGLGTALPLYRNQTEIAA
jgi:O-antigen/teichoic acid export membrane protein